MVVGMKTHHDLDVWRLAIELVTFVYRYTESFPKREMYGLTNQIRRSAVSIPSNIAEGAGRTSCKEFSHFLAIALGSIAELETQLIIANKIGYLPHDYLNELTGKLTSIRRMTLGLKKSIRKE
jgi:four helix bundle protein